MNSQADYCVFAPLVPKPCVYEDLNILGTLVLSPVTGC